MLTQDDTRSADKAERTRELEDILHYNQNILDRLAGLDERLGQLKARLSGDSPKVAAESLNADIPGGIMGHLQSTHQATAIRCDAISGWLDDLECVI